MSPKESVAAKALLSFVAMFLGAVLIAGQIIQLIPLFLWGLVGHTKGAAFAPVVTLTALFMVWIERPDFLDNEGQKQVEIILLLASIAFSVAAYINHLYLKGAWDGSPKLKGRLRQTHTTSSLEEFHC